MIEPSSGSGVRIILVASPLFVDGVLKVNGAEVNALTFATSDEALVIDPTLLTAQQDAELTSLISEDGLIVYDFKGSIHALRARGGNLVILTVTCFWPHI